MNTSPPKSTTNKENTDNAKPQIFQNNLKSQHPKSVIQNPNILCYRKKPISLLRWVHKMSFGKWLFRCCKQNVQDHSQLGLLVGDILPYIRYQFIIEFCYRNVNPVAQSLAMWAKYNSSLSVISFNIFTDVISLMG